MELINESNGKCQIVRGPCMLLDVNFEVTSITSLTPHNICLKYADIIQHIIDGDNNLSFRVRILEGLNQFTKVLFMFYKNMAKVKVKQDDQKCTQLKRLYDHIILNWQAIISFYVDFCLIHMFNCFCALFNYLHHFQFISVFLMTSFKMLSSDVCYYDIITETIIIIHTLQTITIKRY